MILGIYLFHCNDDSHNYQNNNRKRLEYIHNKDSKNNHNNIQGNLSNNLYHFQNHLIL